jgi:hypothetical protein
MTWAHCTRGSELARCQPTGNRCRQRRKGRRRKSRGSFLYTSYGRAMTGRRFPTALDSRGIGRLLCRALICYNLLGWGTHREFTWEVSTMSHAKRASKRRSRAKAVTVLGVAGALSLAGGASGAAVGPPRDTQTANTAVTLHEEEISDVSLSTFYVFDHENAGVRRPGLQLTQRTRSRPGQGSGGCAVDDCAGGGPRCCASCATLNGGCQ